MTQPSSPSGIFNPTSNVNYNVIEGSDNPLTVYARTGLSMWYGQVFEEYLPQLRPWNKLAKLYREMLDDAIIGALMEAIYTPLLSTSFRVEVYEDNDEQKRAKEFIENNLFKIPGQNWREHVEDMMDFMAYGFAVSEKVAYKKPDGLLYLRALIPIGQETLLRWGERDEYGDVTGFIQLNPTDGTINQVAMSKLLHFTWRTRKRSPMGRALLRSLYRPWHFKKNLETLEAIGIERDVGNVPVFTLGEDFYGGGDEKARLDTLKTAADNFRMDTTAYIILPKGVTLEAYASGNKSYNIRLTIRDWQHIIRQRFFADFLSMGSEKVGTQALAKELNTFFKLALVSIQAGMLEVWNRQLIPWLFDINNIKIENPPQLIWNDPSSLNIQSLAQAYTMLVKSNLLVPSKKTIAFIHEQMRIPLDDDALDDLMETIRVDKANNNGMMEDEQGDDDNDNSSETKQETNNNNRK